MPTVLRIGPYRIFFYSADGTEPPHVHVERDASIAKVWLAPTRVERKGGFRAHELQSIGEFVQMNEEILLEAWNGFFRP